MHEYSGAITVQRVGKPHSLIMRLAPFMFCIHNANSIRIVTE